jgi:uncharacterized coiled-coil protein SlyX
MLMSQVSQLKDELKQSTPTKLLNDVTSRLSDLKTTVSNIKDGAPVSEKGLWQFDDGDSDAPLGEHSAATSSGRRGMRDDLAVDSRNSRGSGAMDYSENRNSPAGGGGVGGDGGSAKWRIKALEARVAAQQDEIRELKAQLAEREHALTKLQQRNSVLGARLEDKDQDIATLEGRLTKLKRRLKEADSFAPRAWAVKEAVKGGYGLEAAGLVGGGVSAGKGSKVGANNWLHDEECSTDMVPGYQEFVGLLFEPPAAPLLGMVESFLQVHGTRTRMFMNSDYA